MPASHMSNVSALRQQVVFKQAVISAGLDTKAHLARQMHIEETVNVSLVKQTSGAARKMPVRPHTTAVPITT